ncbi:fibrillarin-like rRNA/tRNA 2'-O-methyltransferase [Haladaptatus sp. F3-133]|jgi:fibrillarin-like pre-rRNA processing protein|uniref:rRNA 2'-O-methyltransferase fibrillarin n=1 Tax=Halorutilus salinus TaxID=2487751 RepID=A0A9Q4GH20_9EURY|nr:fibrillarin-like rRNA/tRNA 2'-O-methyltransferase [Halorutilus salinus]MCX2818345.1 fibrillarin-like rRNA/tRNA 2'-O-methyltransferase [Halorutilus salinus]
MTVGWVDVDGERYPATDGEKVRDERVVDGLRLWHPRRSKASAALVKGVDIPLEDARVLYLGGGAGTTPSYFADAARAVYAVEFAPSPASRLVDVAGTRDRLFPVFADARKPSVYAGIVEGVDVLYQDVATRGQADVAVKNAPFVRDGGRVYVVVKARSEDVTAEPEEKYEEVADRMEDAYDVDRTVDLSPFYDDHAVVIARR